MRTRPILAATLALVPLAATGAPAQAAGSCSISTPSRVAIVSPYRTIVGKLTSSCVNSSTEYASWDVIHPTQGFAGIFIFDGSRTDEMDWYDWEPTGNYRVRPSMAYDDNYDDVAQNTRTMTVKLGSRLSASSSRRGSTVTVSGTVTRYSPSAEKFRPWTSRQVLLQRKSCASCSWTTVKSGTTNRYGKVTLSATSSSTRYWQLKTLDSVNTFGRPSATLKR